jgi:hypothetical protein
MSEDYPCHDCGRATLPEGGRSEYYTVYSHVWEAAGMPHRGFLCVGCLEARLGRKLHRHDFPRQTPINDLNWYRPEARWWHRTDRLRDRLTAPSPQDGVQLALWEPA